MNYKYSLLGLAVSAALLLAAGCSKQDSTTAASAEQGTKAQTPAAAAQSAETAKPADKQPAATTDNSASVAANPPAPAATTPALTASGTNAAVSQIADAMTDSAATNVAAVTNNAVPSAVQSSLAAQQAAVAQSATNQLQTLAGMATNQSLAALSATNQAASTVTNQIQALLDRAKTLCANQKYQEALSNVTQLYTYKLTPAQKQKADDLATQIKTGIAQKATSALSGFLGGGSK